MARLHIDWDFHMSSNPTNISASLKARFKAMGLRVRETVYAIAEDGKETAQLFILSRPARTSKGPGRTRTWDMHDAVRVVKHGNADYVHAQFGWFNGEDYFTYQEQGFDHIGGVWVPGMYAVTEAIEATIAAVEGAVRAVAKP